MPKVKIKLPLPEDIADFVNICSKYDCDINVYDGRTIIDAKSIVGIFSIEPGKTVEVQAITSDEDVIVNLMKDIRKFEVI